MRFFFQRAMVSEKKRVTQELPGKISESLKGPNSASPMGFFEVQDM